MRNISGNMSGAMHQLESFQDAQFQKIARIEATLTEDGKKIEWYE
jgi:hypothetical protein